MSNDHELSLTAEGARVICDLGGVKLMSVVEDHCAGDTKASDDILPDELPDLSHGDGGDGLYLYPLSKIVYCDEKVLMLICGFREGPKFVHTPCSKW